MTNSKAHPGWGWLLMAIAVFVWLVALGVVNNGDPNPPAPNWILGFVGVVFAVAGVMVLLGQDSAYTSLGAFVICSAFGVMGLWVALLAPAEGMSGGVPFIPRAANLKLGRWVFGLGSIVSFAMAYYAAAEFNRKRKSRTDDLHKA